MILKNILVLVFLSNFQCVKLKLVISTEPNDIKTVMDENYVLPAKTETTFVVQQGIRLEPSGASIALIGHRTVITVFCESVPKTGIKFRVLPRSQGTVHVLTREITFKQWNWTALEYQAKHSETVHPENHAEVVLIGLRPGRALLDFEVSFTMSLHFPSAKAH